jgi:serine/threonine-protein kinase
MNTSLQTQAPETVRKIGGYEIIRPIGAGGIAEIFLARQPSLDRTVAVKILSPRVMDDPEIKRRFDREALTIAKLHHPNIIHVIDRGVEDGRFYFVMDYVDGDNLKVLASKRKLTVPERCDLVVQTLKALDYAHKNGVIHRDIKPANILVDTEMNVHVADFGIAQIVDPEHGENTSTSVIMGTPAYMSPEQKVSSAKVDQTTDLYSVGVVLYELLTGEKPQGRFRPASSYSIDIPAGLDDVINNALSQHPVDRFQTAVEFKDAILASLAHAGADPLAGDTSFIRKAAKFMGKCHFLDTIKEHPYGATYLVEDRDTQQLLVIKKIVHRSSGLKEAQLLSRLKHPHIVNILGAGNDGDKAVVLMEYARGGSLSDRLVRKMPWANAAEILKACAEALTFAHKNHILHGNIRPSNILISKDGVPLLADFGLPEHYARTRTNWYGAPEREQSIQSDIYSLGVVIYHLISNQLPLYDRDGNLHPIWDLADVPQNFSRILDKMLTRSLVSRYRVCDEILDDLANCLEIQKSPIPKISLRAWRKKYARMKWSDWLIGFVSGVIVATLLTYTLGWLDFFFKQ